MPRGRLNVENEPRGVCVCLRPTIAIEDAGQRNRRMVCILCRLPLAECKCVPATPEYCPKCGERTGLRTPEGIFYQPGRGHQCKK